MLRSDWGKKCATSSKGIKTTVLLLTWDLSRLRLFKLVKVHQTTGWTCSATPEDGEQWRCAEQPPPRGLDKNRWNKSTSHTLLSPFCRYGSGGGRNLAPVALIPVPRSAETVARLSRASFIHEWILWARFQFESTRPRCCVRVSATWLPDRKQLDVSKRFQRLFAWRVQTSWFLAQVLLFSVLGTCVWVSAPRCAVGTQTDVWGVSGVLRGGGSEAAAPSSRPDSARGVH